MSEKVTVSRKVAQVIEDLRNVNGMSDMEIAVRHKNAADGDFYPWTRCLLEIPFGTLLDALYFGYEVERSPEEDVANYIAVLRKKTAEDGNNTHWQDELIGAQTVVHKLGIQLPEKE